MTPGLSHGAGPVPARRPAPDQRPDPTCFAQFTRGGSGIRLGHAGGARTLPGSERSSKVCIIDVDDVRQLVVTAAAAQPLALPGR
jgi:hypothetical protein